MGIKGDKRKMKSIKRTVYGSFLRICEFGSETQNCLNIAKPYIWIDGDREYVDIIQVTPCGITERGNSLFCYELLLKN